MNRLSTLTAIPLTALLFAVLFIALQACEPALPPDPFKFDLGDGSRMSGFTQVNTSAIFSRSKGFGLFTTDTLASFGSGEQDGITSSVPFYFAKALPEGNYRVTVKLGDPKGTSNTTIKAENRRLMVDDLTTAQGETEEVSFLVHIRQPIVAGTDSVGRNKREYNYSSWDDKLTLEFGGERPCVQWITIAEDKEAPVVFLTGNSTVVDQAREPWGSWGQLFPVFFKDEVVIANHAESGQTMKAFIAQRRLEKIEEQLKPGDYVFMEFAHNDQKPGGNHLDPFTTYQEHLMIFANKAREKGATPVFVTSTNRRAFDEEGKLKNTLLEYPDAMRQLAAQEAIALIDLNAMTKTLYESHGVEASKKIFVHYPANSFDGMPKDVADNTHFNYWGAYQLAKCVVEGLKKTDLPLKNLLKEGLPAFDPSKPEKIEDWKWIVSPIDEVVEFEELEFH